MVRADPIVMQVSQAESTSALESFEVKIAEGP